MKYVFIDTEGAIRQKSGLKTLGIVVTDENFNVTDQREVYIDMDEEGLKRENYRVDYNAPISKDDIAFNQTYEVIRDYLTAEDAYVLGFSALTDVDNINKANERHKMEPLKYDFFDVQQLYVKLFSLNDLPGLSACVTNLGITEQFEYHKSVSDALATARVLQKLCEKFNLTVAQCIAKYPEFGGHTEQYMATYNVESMGHTYGNSSSKMFKIRVDLPLLYFKKKIGAVRPEDGKRDGVTIYYDVILDRLFPDRHPHRGVAKAMNDCLVFDKFLEMKWSGYDKLKKEQWSFFKADAPLIIKKYIVSYECVCSIEGDTMSLLHGNRYLRQVSDENWYVDMMFKAHINPDTVIRKYYTADMFEQTLRRNTKWNYGDRKKELTVETTPYEYVQHQDGDETYLPRVYYSVLTNEFEDGATVACSKEHFCYATAPELKTPVKNVVDIDTLHLDDSAIKLVVKDKDSNVYGFIPVTRKINFPMFNCTYELPLLIRRKLNTDIFE